MKYFEELWGKIQAIENIELYVLVDRFAREGERISQYELAKRYDKGQMVKKSKHNAASFSQKAALSGDKDAKEFFDDIMKKDR